MKSTKLFRLLSSFTNEELRQFDLFLQSPYFNRSPILIDLFEYIRPFHPTFNQESLTKENIYKALSRKPPFVQKFVNDRMSDLTKLVESFLAIEHFNATPALKNKALRKSLISHQQYTLFKTEVEKKIKKLQRKPSNDWERFLELWSLQYELFNHPETNKWNEKKDDSAEMMANLDEAYLILKLRFGFHQKLRGTIFNEDGSFYSELLKPALKQHRNPVIRLYILFLENFETTDIENHWKEIYKFYLDIFEDLPKDDQKSGLIGLINRAYKIALAGQADFFNSIFKLYQFGLDEKLLVKGGKLPENTFKNIALLGASTGEYKWTANFINKYKQKLPPSSDNVFYFAHAYLSFYSGAFEEALVWLEKTTVLPMRDKNSFKSLKLRCLFELYCKDKSYRETIYSFLDAYSRFLQRTKILSEDLREVYRNFIFIIRLLTDSKHLSPKLRMKEWKKINKEIEKRQGIIAKKWVLEKVAELAP